MRISKAAILILILTVALASAPAASQSPGAAASSGEEYTPGVVWVKLAPGANAESERAGKWQNHAISGRLGATAWVRLEVPQGQEKSSAAAFMQREDVLRAEPEFFVHAAGVPDDPSYSSQWNMDRIRAPLAWDFASGSADAIVAVLDTGVDLNHLDLVDNLWQNLGEVADNGIDDDLNGFVDDRWGWDLVNQDPVPQDDYGHGTHVAGIAGAVGNNGRGVAGMMWHCRIMAVKVLNYAGSGTYARVAEGAYYAVENGARIVNMSLAGSDYSQVLQDAITDLYLRYGAMFVAAAGNCANGGSSCGSVNPVMYPAAMENVISVASTDSGDQRASTSEYNAYVDIAAPGQYVYSLGVGGGYRYSSGTSMATPHVAGLAALVRSLRPAWNPDMVEEHLKSTAAKVGGVVYDASGRNDQFGYGRIDAAAALWALDLPHLTVDATEVVRRIAPGESIAASVTVTNTCAAAVPWSAEVISGADWLTVVPPEGIIAPESSSVLNFFVPEDIAPGLYRGQVRITSSHPFWDGDAPVVEFYVLVLKQGSQVFFPFVFL